MNFVHQDAIGLRLVYDRLEFQPFRTREDVDFLLILNPADMNRESIQAMIDDKRFRQQFVERIIEHAKQSNIEALKYWRTPTGDALAEFIQDRDEPKLREILAQHYDKYMASLNADDVLRQAQEAQALSTRTQQWAAQHFYLRAVEDALAQEKGAPEPEDLKRKQYSSRDVIHRRGREAGIARLAGNDGQKDLARYREDPNALAADRAQLYDSLPRLFQHYKKQPTAKDWDNHFVQVNVETACTPYNEEQGEAGKGTFRTDFEKHIAGMMQDLPQAWRDGLEKTSPLVLLADEPHEIVPDLVSLDFKAGSSADRRILIFSSKALNPDVPGAGRFIEHHAVVEEVCHYLDSMTKFSARKEWQEAVAAALQDTSFKTVVDTICEAKGKRKPMDYMDDEVAHEMLAELACIKYAKDAASAANVAQFNEHLPIRLKILFDEFEKTVATYAQQGKGLEHGNDWTDSLGSRAGRKLGS